MALFSIITVVYNGASLLPGTMESVKNQNFTNYEHLVIDGNSTDATPEILARYAVEMPQLKWISEPDKGLYDAMNKGIKRATGEFIWFLNCGDHLHAPDTLEHLAGLISPETDVLYGDTLLVNDCREPAGLMSELSTRSLPVHLTWRDYLGGMRVVHQSFVVRRQLAGLYEMGNLCADYDWSIRILKLSRKNVFTGLILSDYLMGGVSKKRHLRSLIDRFRVMRRHFGLLPSLIAHAAIVLRAIFHRLKRLGKPRY